eukprot:TRINITY_DN9511_c0_g1_i8.p1 TRINITY_DN9511_c0_g1~~TRINITY_DN9511_c0_g1_i8.p1  ORF type:complete len:232 (+),score=35.05 TRINITY_DN9511_c0_g1_i8:76-771(+)
MCIRDSINAEYMGIIAIMDCPAGDKTHIAKKKLFICEYPDCGQIFKTRFSCKRHTLTHTKEKPYTCSECDKKFSLLQHLKEHSYRHTREKPYVCGIKECTQSFRHASELSLHRRTHAEYELRKYKFLKPGKLKADAGKTGRRLEGEKRAKGHDEDGKTFDSSKDFRLPRKLEISIADIPVTTPKTYSNDTTELDAIFLNYLHTIRQGNVCRPVLPLPGSYFVFANGRNTSE